VRISGFDDEKSCVGQKGCGAQFLVQTRLTNPALIAVLKQIQSRRETHAASDAYFRLAD